MRVAFVSQFSEQVGGGEHSLKELIGYLPSSIEPVLILPASGEMSRWARMNQVPVHILPMPKLGSGSLSAIWNWRCYLKSGRFDVIHANQSRAAFYAGCAAMGLRSKVIFHCRVAQSDGLMDWMLMRLCDAIICNSRAVADRFGNFSGTLKVIYNGVVQKHDSTSASPEIPEDAGLLLFVGRLSSEKQPQLALQLFEQLADKHPDLHFAMIGGDDPQDSQFSQLIRERASSSSFAKRIHMPGAVSSVTGWYRRASILLLTSRHEGFGRVLVEAMAEGVVPVAFSVGGVPEVVEHDEQGFLVQPDDLKAMKDYVDELIGNELLRKRLSEKGEVRAAFFSVENHVASVENLYRELLRHG